MATNYGMVMVGFGLGAIISSYVAGYFKNKAVDDISLMFPAFLIASFSHYWCFINCIDKETKRNI